MVLHSRPGGLALCVVRVRWCPMRQACGVLGGVLCLHARVIAVSQ